MKRQLYINSRGAHRSRALCPQDDAITCLEIGAARLLLLLLLLLTTPAWPDDAASTHRPVRPASRHAPPLAPPWLASGPWR